MKRHWGILTFVLLGLLLSTNLFSANVATAAQVVAGKSCTKKSSTKIVSGKRYTCVIKNKKLVWSSGVTVQASTPKQSLTPTPTPTPVDQNLALASRIVVLFNNSSSLQSYSFDVTFCPNVNKTMTDKTISAYKSAMQLWSNFFIPTKPMKWVMFSNDDYSCWLDTVNKLEGPSGDTNVWNSQTNIMGHCQLSPGAFCGYGTGVKPDGSFIQYNAIGTAFTRSPVPEVVHHESVHFYQMALEGQYKNTTQVGTLPGWFIEGQANLIGMTVAAKGMNYYQREFEIGRLKKVIPTASDMTAEQWLQELYSLDSRQEFIFRNELGYSLGWLCLERVYQLYTFEQMHDLLLKVNQGSSWSQAIQLSLGTDKATLYSEIAKHLAKEIN